MNCRLILEKTVKDLKADGRRKNVSFEFAGSHFPLGPTKQFLKTFKPKDELWVSSADSSLFFTWKTGHAHINSVKK